MLQMTNETSQLKCMATLKRFFVYFIILRCYNKAVDSNLPTTKAW